jgi:hypothetical protein
MVWSSQGREKFGPSVGFLSLMAWPFASGAIEKT